GGCRDHVRFDVRADAKGEIKLLDVNPNRGWCWDGKVNIMAGFQGMRYAELLSEILQAAVERLGIVAKPVQAAAGNGHGHSVAAEGGARGANGAHSFTAAALVHGDPSSWPRRGPGSARTPPPAPGRRRRCGRASRAL